MMRFVFGGVLGLFAVMIPSCGQLARDSEMDIEKYVEEVRASRGGAKLVCAEEEHDFGTVWADGHLCHTFNITNTGNQIAHVQVLPGYSGFGLEKYFDLEPGKSHAFEACLNSRKLNGPFEKCYTVRLRAESFERDDRCSVCRMLMDSDWHLRFCGAISSNP